MPKNLSARMRNLVNANRRKHGREFYLLIRNYDLKNKGRNYGDYKNKGRNYGDYKNKGRNYGDYK